MPKIQYICIYMPIEIVYKFYISDFLHFQLRFLAYGSANYLVTFSRTYARFATAAIAASISGK